MKLLLVEDDKVLSEVLHDEFVHQGYKVENADDGEEGLKKAKDKKPDLILLDLLLPKKDGFQVLEELKNDADLKHIPVIILSNLGQDEDIKRALKLGASDYFVKAQHPIKEIVEKVQKILVNGKI